MVKLVGDDFHAHLDVCERCRKNPFNLCAKGAELLMKAPAEIEAELGRPLQELEPWQKGK